jgi:hypothetical protein
MGFAIHRRANLFLVPRRFRWVDRQNQIKDPDGFPYMRFFTLEPAVETTDCPMSLRSETRMNTDYQSNANSWSFTSQVTGWV